MATINGDSSDNTLTGTSGADSITADAGNDTVFGGGGNDTIDGGSPLLSTTPLFLDWTNQGNDGDSIAGGFSQDTGGITAAVSFTNDGAGTSATVATNETYTETGEPFDPFSGLGLRADGGAAAWTTTIDFTANPGSGLSGGVENVSFRIQDVDEAGWEDIVTIIALDANGDPVEIEFTPAGDDTTSGNVITAGPTSTGATDALGSVLVEIAGPVSNIAIIYENGGDVGQLLYVTDVHFDAVPQDDDELYGGGGRDTISGGFGNDLIDGGSGSDKLFGNTGNDTLFGQGGRDELFGDAGQDELYGGSGFDTLDGGAGADTLDGGNGNDTFFAGSGDTVIGGEGGTDTNDTLIVGDVERIEYDPSNNENGTVFFNDGTTATFTGIENFLVNGGPDGIVQGTASDDFIDASYVDQNLEQIDNNDGTLGTIGNQDSVEAGAGNDTVFAGAANDTVRGGADTASTQQETFSWISEGAGGFPASGITQDTGFASITVQVANNGGLSGAEINTTTQYVEAGDPFAANSGLSLSGNGGADVATAMFTSDTPLTDVSFRINDIDTSSWQDILTINAFDANGDPVAVTITPAGNDTVSGNTITGGPNNDSANSASGSALIEIAGPVASFEVVYENGSTGGQVIYLTDVHYTAVDPDADTLLGEAGDDTLLGGYGEDELYGGADDDAMFGGQGNDALFGGSGEDEIRGGEGADIIDAGDDRDLIIGGSGDVIDGGEGGDDFDRLQIEDTGATIAYDPINSENGTVTFTDGTTLTFTNIEQVVVPCFTPGTEVVTAFGPVAVEQLQVGDKVLTRDHGFQSIRWIGIKTLSKDELKAARHLRPIMIREHAIAPNMPHRDMMVSPQHRMVISDPAVQLISGQDEVLVKAKHLTHRDGIERASADEVTYIHFMFDQHELVLADGAWSESFQPGDMISNPEQQDVFGELLELFPELAKVEGRKRYDSARPSLKDHEARLIA